MKPAPDRLSQIAKKYASGGRPGDRVPMRMEGMDSTSACARFSGGMESRRVLFSKEISVSYLMNTSFLISRVEDSNGMDRSNPKDASMANSGPHLHSSSTSLECKAGRACRHRDIQLSQTDCTESAFSYRSDPIEESFATVDYESEAAQGLMPRHQLLDVYFHKFPANHPDKRSSRSVRKHCEEIFHPQSLFRTPDDSANLLNDTGSDPPGETRGVPVNELPSESSLFHLKDPLR